MQHAFQRQGQLHMTVSCEHDFKNRSQTKKEIDYQLYGSIGIGLIVESIML